MIIIRCKNCQARVQIPSPGTYRCHNCRKILEVNEQNYPEIFPIRPSSTAETKQINSEPVKPPDDVSKQKDTSLSFYGAKCKRHPHNAATKSCARCGDMLCDSCAIRLESRYYCSECIAKIQRIASASSEEEERIARAGKSSIPIENYKKDGYLKSFFLTIWTALYKFHELFNISGKKEHAGIAVVYAVILNCLYDLTRYVSVHLLNFSAIRLPESTAQLIKDIYYMYAEVKLIYLLASPLRAFLGILLLAAVYHIAVMLVGGAEKYSTTLKITCYSMSSLAFPIALFFVPALPWILALVFGILIVIQGSIQYHEIPEGKAIFVAFFPYLIILTLTVITVIILIVSG